MPKLTRLTLLGLLPFLIPAVATAAEQPDVLKKNLPPEKIQQIQAISQAVLTAKRNQPSNPEMDNLRQRVDELHRVVVELHGKTLRTGKINALSLESGLSATPASNLRQDNQKIDSERVQAETDVRRALERVRGQRAVIEQKVAESAAGEDHAMKRNAAAKVRALEDELDKSLQSPPEERAANLQAIEERLVVKKNSLTEADKQKTPTISTIVRHRE